MESKALFFEDVTEGMKIGPLVKKASTMRNFMYIAATWICDPMHRDYKFATEVMGFPDVLQLGPISADWNAQLVTEFIGDTGYLKKVSYQSRVNIIPDDMLTCSGTVIRKYSDSNYHCIDFELAVVNQKNENCSPGKATVVLPLRGERLDIKELADRHVPLETTPEPEQRQTGHLLTKEVLEFLGFQTGNVLGDPITAKEIRRYALAIGDPNPVYHNQEEAEKSRYGGIIAPPCFTYWACHPASQDDFPENLTIRGRLKREAQQIGAFAVPELPLPNTAHGGTEVHGGDEHEFFHPLRPGDVLTGRSKIVDMQEKSGKVGSLIFLVLETQFKNQRDQLVDIVKTTVIYY